MRLLCSDVNFETVESKLTNDYIINETIDIIKIKDLTTTLTNINNNIINNYVPYNNSIYNIDLNNKYIININKL